MKKFSPIDHKLLAVWAARCAERVLPFFERAHPKDHRPRTALLVCREWIRTGVFSMKVIRRASLSAHAAARDAGRNDAARFAARAVGQAVATAHVPQHAFGSAYYALKAVAAADPNRAGAKAAKELDWQVKHASGRIRKEVIKRVNVQNRENRVWIKIRKGKDY
jgi:hypothetical protein